MLPYACLLTALVLGLGAASAHPREYLNVAGDTPLIPFDCDDESLPSVGVVCFAAGHIVADAEGRAFISITDDLTAVASAFHCVDADGDFVCGEERESVETFCGTHEMVVGVDWDGIEQVIVFLDGPLFGNLATSACGETSVATSGEVTHS